MPPLTKRDAEVLMAVLAAPAATADAEVAQLRDAVGAALSTVLGATDSFDKLVGMAAAAAGWPKQRADDLTNTGDPQLARDALWDLAAELNEVRGLRPTPGRQQREAVNAIERAIAAINRSDAPAVRTAAAAVGQLDAAGVYPRLSEALEQAAAAIESAGSASDEVRRVVADALGPGPLAAEVLEGGQPLR